MKKNPNVTYNSIKKLVSYDTNAIWKTLPTTIKWLQNQRSTPLSTERLRGINITIIWMSAACIEGFQVECLHSFSLGNKFADIDNLEGRLAHDFHNRISKAMFRDFPDLFALTLGKPISKIVNNEPLIKGVIALIEFRNGIAHARPVVYENYAVGSSDANHFEIESQYATVYNYLKDEKLISGKEELFSNKIADHFASLVHPYIMEVFNQLPKSKSFNVGELIRHTFNPIHGH